MPELRHKVVLTEHLDEGPAAWLGDRVRLVRCSHEDADVLRAELADADGLIVRTYTRVDDGLLIAGPGLKVVARAGVGLDNIDLDACGRRAVRVVYTPDANTQAVVEYVWALVLDAMRPRQYLSGPTTPEAFHRYRRECCAKRQLTELTLGVLGMGRIGRRVAQVAGAIGMRVVCNDLLAPAELSLPAGQPGKFVDKPTLWREADVLTLHVDGRASNRHLIDVEVMEQLKPECTVINTARGNLVHRGALAAWARRVKGQGGRAFLDVHDPEPPPADDPLFGFPNVMLLPHLASRTAAAMLNMSWVVRDVDRVLRGEEPRWAAV